MGYQGYGLGWQRMSKAAVYSVHKPKRRIKPKQDASIVRRGRVVRVIDVDSAFPVDRKVNAKCAPNADGMLWAYTVDGRRFVYEPRYYNRDKGAWVHREEEARQFNQTVLKRTQ